MGNKKAIVTGGSRGIGKGIVQKLASLGYDVAFSYNSAEAEAVALRDELAAQYGVACYCYQASLQERGVPRQLFDQAVADLNGLDLLACNAGITVGSSALHFEEDKLDMAISLDYKSYLLMTSYAANYMVEHDVKGSIIYITSTHSLRAYPYDALYGSLKAGLNRAVESLACELGNYGIRVNAIAPGFIQVRFNNEWPEYEQNVKVLGKLLPLNRIGNPEDIANAIEFLASDDAKYITGVTVKVDGGLILAGMPESDKPEFNKRIWGYRDHYGFVKKKEEQK